MVALLPMSSLAAETLDLKGIGRMTVPKNVTFEKSAQAALPFLSAGGTERFFLRRGMTSSVYYTMIYANPPDLAMAGRCRISSGCLIFSASER